MNVRNPEKIGVDQAMNVRRQVRAHPTWFKTVTDESRTSLVASSIGAVTKKSKFATTAYTD